jgi:hypothetical protein
MNYGLTMPKGKPNAKTGKMPVSTTSEVTCPHNCPLKRAGCYAEGGPLAIHWRKITSGERGTDLAGFAAKVASLPEGQIWRHNQAGDLPGDRTRINLHDLREIVKANRGRRGFTYTHYPMDVLGNAEAIREANEGGFTINLSADNTDQVDTLAEYGPVCVTVPTDTPKVTRTAKGTRIVVCPAQVRNGVTCATCQLCQRADRDYAIAFRVHGAGAKKVTFGGQNDG